MSQTVWPAKRSDWMPLAGWVAAILAGAVAGSQGVELFINRVLRPDLAEWTWISEILMTLALLVITTLWTRLRLAQTALVALERERTRAQAELAVAANVQRGLLPAIPPPSDGIAWSAAMEPAGLVGGDYYDFFNDESGRMWLLVADVSGKGVPAAVFVSNARAVLRAVAREPVTPAQLLSTVSDILLADGRGDLYVTCFAAMVDTRERTMIYANAGHPPGVVVNGSVHALAVGGPPLGLLHHAVYCEERIDLSTGDLVLIVSDGVTDGLNASGSEIPHVLADEIERARARTPEEACETLLRASARGPGPDGSLAWTDDRTVLAFRVSDQSA